VATGQPHVAVPATWGYPTMGSGGSGQLMSWPYRAGNPDNYFDTASYRLGNYNYDTVSYRLGNPDNHFGTRPYCADDKQSI